MIKSFKHKGLQVFYETGNTRGIQSKHAAKLRLQLAALDNAKYIADLDIPGFRLHLLKGKREADWSIRVSGKWCITFRFESGHVFIVDYEDYH